MKNVILSMLPYRLHILSRTNSEFLLRYVCQHFPKTQEIQGILVCVLQKQRGIRQMMS